MSEKCVAVHKEFTREHRIISTVAYTNQDGDTLEECQSWCDKANANSFNYRPYPASEFLRRPAASAEGDE